MEAPTLVLQRKNGGVIGPLGYYHGLKLGLKYSALSTGSFLLPKTVNGASVPHYDDVLGNRVIRIDPYGQFLVDGPETTCDGVTGEKNVALYSLEYELAFKSITLEAGTFRLYNPLNPRDGDTIMGRVLEKARNWSMGSVDKSLWSVWRTFDEQEVKIHSFLMDTVQATFGCLFLFDTYQRRIEIRNADADLVMTPVYLSYDNLVKEGSIKEIDDQFVTGLTVSGADGVDIRDVNPTGSSVLYNLDYPIATGDLSGDLAGKWKAWQNAIRAKQPLYAALVNLRSTSDGQYLAEKAKLTDLEGELTSLENIRSTSIQMLAQASQDSTREYMNQRLEEIAELYQAKEAEIEAQNGVLARVEASYQSYHDQITAIVGELGMANYFTQAELDELDHYISEDTLTDNTFAAFDLNISGDADGYASVQTATVRFEDVSLIDVDMPDALDAQVRMFEMTGGTLTISGSSSAMNSDGSTASQPFTISAQMIHSIVEHKGTDTVLSAFLGPGSWGVQAFPSGTLTLSVRSSYSDAGVLDGMQRVVVTTKDDETGVSRDDTHYEGGWSFAASGGSCYFTRNATESQRYYVCKELYDYAKLCQETLAWPTFEFELSTGNLLFDRAFEAFKNALRLGCGCYLSLDDGGVLRQQLIEVHLDYEDPTQFRMVFSNQFQRKGVNASMRRQLDESVGASRTLNYNKHEYAALKNSGMYNEVANFIQEGLDSVTQRILAGKEQTVTIDGKGIKVKSVGGSEYLLIADGQMAIVDDATGVAKMAIGHFYNTASGQDYTGVLADVIGGDLLVGLNLNITCPDINGGIAQFKVDSSGAFLNNSRFYLQNDGGGKIGLDANYGLFMGLSPLFDVTDTGYVKPCFINADGSIQLDEDGFPVNANFWADLRTGDLYLRGKIYATDGVFHGTVYATSGQFNGIVQASAFLDASGKSMMTSGKFDADYLNLKGLTITNEAGNVTFQIDSSGNTMVNGNITMGAGSTISWSNLSTSVQDRITGAEDAAEQADNAAATAADNVRKLAQGKYTDAGTTFISGTQIFSPVIDSCVSTAGEFNGGSFNIYQPGGGGKYDGGLYVYNARDQVVGHLYYGNAYNSSADAMFIYGVNIKEEADLSISLDAQGGMLYLMGSTGVHINAGNGTVSGRMPIRMYGSALYFNDEEVGSGAARFG